MAITISCECGHTLRVKDEYGGKRGKCPKCAAIIPIPLGDEAIVALEAVGPLAAGPGSAAVKAAPLASAVGDPPGPSAAVPLARKTAAPAAAERLPPRSSTAPAATAFAVPAAPAAHRHPQPAAPLTEDQLRASIFAGFLGPIEPVRTTWMYKLGILLTALFMVLLPLIYIGIIGLACLAVWWHLTNNYGIVGAVRGRGAIMALLVYLAPIVIGGIVILFMIKPLFARPAKEGRRRNVTPHSDPLLFEFVERICQLVGAPMPRRIDIDCDVNASAAFRRGWLSMLTGRDLVLTIGMPLVTGLSLQQLAGVLAHEFGHFAQGAGMRLTYVIRSINFWFVRVVYERDEWDEWLANSTSELDLRIAWVLWLAQACVWTTRKILWGLMYLGHMVAGFMLRQMEFDADKYETRVAGSESFEATCRQLRLLGFSYQGAQQDLGDYYREGRLVDNLPLLIQANLKQLPSKAHEVVEEMIGKTETGTFDSHPADKDRIAAARAEQTPGVFRSDLPATALFANVEAAAQNVTWDFYCAAFEKTVDRSTLSPTADLIARQEQEQAAAEARDRFFAGAFSVLRPLRLPVAKFTQDGPLWQQQLAQARAAMESLAPAYAAALKPYDEHDTHLVQARQARSVLSTGVRLQADGFHRVYRSSSEAHQHREQTQAAMARMGSGMEPFEEAGGKRLMAAVTLLFDPQLVQHLPQAEPWQQEARKLLPIVSTVTTNHGSLMELRNCNATLVALLGHLGQNQQSETLIREILDYSRRVREQLFALRNSFERIDYPFDHASGQIPVSQFLVKILPQEEEVGAVYEVTDDVLRNLMNLYARALGRLCLMAENVEAQYGYQPLPRATEEKALH